MNYKQTALEEINIQGQKWVEGNPFPRVLIPSPAISKSKSSATQTTVELIRQEKARLEEYLHSSGAVWLRGLHIQTPGEFNEVVEALGFEEFPYVGSIASRTHVGGRVYTANDSPHDQKIPFHHEMAQLPDYPSKLVFFCHVEPAKGGETPIVLSHAVYNRMLRSFPDFVADLENKGVLYVRVFGEEDDTSSAVGRGWHSTFHTTDKNEAEIRARKLGMKIEWLGDESMKTITGPVPAIKFDDSRRRKTWFNNMVSLSAYSGCKYDRHDPDKAVTFGDGTLLPRDVLLSCLEILEEESVSIPWQQGDILILDNMAVLHSRNPFEPPRKVLASFCK